MKVLTRSYATPIAEAALLALRNDPLIAPLVKEHYWGEWPDKDTLANMPDGTLGKELIRTLKAFDYQGLPNPIIREELASDDQWLHQRLRHTHDIWHVVTGLPATPAGEAALHAFMVMQLRWPGSLLLLGADLMERCLKGPLVGETDMGLAVAFGLQLGCVCAPLASQRWEEGWDRSLTEWREQLGIAEFLKQSPFNKHAKLV
jgi:ubiquinone biosynthesis protein Coq4